MSFEPFQVATPKGDVKAKAPVKPKPEEIPIAPEPVALPAPVVKKTRAKRPPRTVEDDLGEHVVFMKLYNDMTKLPKGPRLRILNALLKALS